MKIKGEEKQLTVEDVLTHFLIFVLYSQLSIEISDKYNGMIKREPKKY